MTPRFESTYDEDCENCDGVRCMHFVLRDWWASDFDDCDGWCCPTCRPRADAFNQGRIMTRYVRLDDVLDAIKGTSRGDYGEGGWHDHDPDLVLDILIEDIERLPTAELEYWFTNAVKANRENSRLLHRCQALEQQNPDMLNSWCQAKIQRQAAEIRRLTGTDKDNTDSPGQTTNT